MASDTTPTLDHRASADVTVAEPHSMQLKFK
jgi:hypothetical protein